MDGLDAALRFIPKCGPFGEKKGGVRAYFLIGKPKPILNMQKVPERAWIGWRRYRCN